MGKLAQDLALVLRYLRKRKGCSQAEIAQLLGLTRTAYTYYEMGKVMPSLDAIRKLAEFYDEPLETLIYPEKYTI